MGLAELPAALAMLTEAPFVAPFGPAGDKALPAFSRAANLDPDDTWTWIVVVLKDPGTMDRALLEAARSAEAQGDWRGRAFAMQVSGLLLELRGRPADADQHMRALFRSPAIAARRRRPMSRRRGNLPAACYGSAA